MIETQTETDSVIDAVETERRQVVALFEDVTNEHLGIEAQLGELAVEAAALLQANVLDEGALKKVRGKQSQLLQRQEILTARVSALRSRGEAVETRGNQLRAEREHERLAADVRQFEADVLEANHTLVAGIKRIQASIPLELRSTIVDWDFLYGGELARDYLIAMHGLAIREIALRNRGAGNLPSVIPYGRGLIALMRTSGELS